MTRKMSRHAAAGLMAVWMFLGSSVADAKIPKVLDYKKHALGWDTLNLDLVEKDSAGRPTLESESNKKNRVARRTTYYPNGKKAAQTFTVVELATDKTLYLGKKDWIENGDLESTFIRDDVFNTKGHPEKGWISEKHFRNGRLAVDIKRKYSEDTGDWTVLHRQTLSYYEDGDLQERITEDRPGTKKWETWGKKEGSSRKASVKNWDASSRTWK